MRGIFLLIVFFTNLILAEDIKEYDVYVKVHNNGKLSVKESIVYNFGNEYRHGIFRDIPIKHNLFTNIRALRDGKWEKYEVLNYGNMLRIKIGDKNKLLLGTHRYDIFYDIDNVVSKLDDKKNAIIFNAIGTEWKIPIKNVNIYIYLPFKLANAKLETFSGEYGSRASNVKVEKISNTTYHLKVDYLPPYNGVTFRLSFDSNLIKANTPTLSIKWVIWFLIIFSIGVFLYWYKFGKNPRIGSVTPQYYPPKDLDVLEAGLILDSFADEKDISTAILYLASEGYLKIKVSKKEENFISKIFDKPTIRLIKTSKLPTDLKKDMKLLYYALFENGKKTFIVGKKDKNIAKKLQEAIDDIDEYLYEWSEKEGFMKKNPKKVRTKFAIISTLIALPFIVFAIYQTYKFIGDIIWFEVFAAIWLGLGIYAFFKIAPTIIFKIIILLFFIIIPTLFIFSAIPYENLIKPFPLILLVFIPIILATLNMGVYTKKGIEKLRYLLGFKDFIKKVEKDKINLLLKEDKNYLDKILPYAVLFGVSEHWLKFYVDSNIEPYWYSGDIHYISSLGTNISEGFYSSAHYSESSGGGASGGFSGGGSGGGGGGSW